MRQLAATFKRLQKLVEGTDEKELSFKGLKIMKIVLDNYQHLAVVDLRGWYTA